MKVSPNSEFIKEISRRTGIKPGALCTRYRAGDRGEVLERPKFERKGVRKRSPRIFVVYKEREWSLLEVAEETGYPLDTIYHRYNRGDREEELFRPRCERSPKDYVK